MSYFAKKRIFYYRVLKLDIWGLIRNNLQYKIDRVNYDINNIFIEAKLVERQGFFFRGYYKRGKFTVYNKIDYNPFISYVSFIHQNRVKSILYFYLLFYFFKITISKRLYNIYKAFFFNKSKYFEKKFYRAPFIYEPRIYYRPPKRYNININHINLQLVRLFYVIYSYKQIRKLIRKAKRSDDVFEHKFILLMECKLPSFVYRSSFFSNIFESIKFIKGGNLWVNKKIISNLYYSIKIMDFVGFYSFLKGFIFWSFFKRIRRKAFLFLYPKYMYISLVFFFIIFIRLPLNKEFINTVAVDAYRVSNYI